VRRPVVSIEFVKSVPLFSDVSDRDLAGIARWLRRRDCAAGANLTDEGEGGIGFFVVESGTATVSIGDQTVRTLVPHDYFGEVALLANSQRTATITAIEDLVCWGLPAWNFTALVKAQPTIAMKLLEGLARQIAR
jgi:CRP-like cAMP-binding protein